MRTIAKVRILIGNRNYNKFIRSADLGISNAGLPNILTIEYKEGEVVTEERVMNSIQAMIDTSNKEQTPFEIFNPQLIGIYGA